MLRRLQNFSYLGIITCFAFFQCTSPPDKQFTELSSEETGLVFRNDIVETQYNNIMTYEYTYNGSGIAAGDINNDGLTDLYFSGNSVPNKLFLNKGRWQFEDITATAKTAGRKDWKTGVTMVDINSDGWLDIYVCYSGNAPREGYNLPIIKDYPNRANQLFINNGCEPGGTPTFTEQAKEFGLDAIGTFSTQAYFLDYDRDDDLDMFLVNHANMFYSAFFNTRRLRNLRHPYFGNKLYRNDSPRPATKKMIFREVSAEAGLHGSGLNFGLSASITDLNFDGWPDIYVTNDYEEQDFCYVNNRNGTFREVSHKLFTQMSKFGMGSDVGDINNDGLQEILVLDMLPEDNHRQKLLKGPDEYDRYKLAVDSGYHHQYMRNTLQLNRGFAEDTLPRFSEIGQFAGISNTDWSWTPFFIDMDNDGLKDIFITNGYLRDFTNLDFMKYTSTVYQEAKTANRPVDYLNLVQQLPTTRISNYAFKNVNGISFKDMSEAWGITRDAVSNGAVYADLDNDGDYDLITNNLNDQVTVLRNNQETIQKNNYIKIKLNGKSPNTMGIGAKIKVETDSAEITQEAYFTRGYASSVEPLITVGIGRSEGIKRIQVTWPDGAKSVLENVSPNQTVVVDQEKSQPVREEKIVPNNILLQNVTNSTGIRFKHQENSYVDFKFQRLLFYQLSMLGGKIARGDVNKDGNDDIFLGGASGQAGQLYEGKEDGTFQSSRHQPWTMDKKQEDMSSLFFDCDGDGDDDLYVVSGGSEFDTTSTLYQDRLYINKGKSGFVKAEDALPLETSSGGCVATADYDKDGDLDLFVGGRQTPGAYSVIPQSYLLQNNSKPNDVQFSDVTSEVNKDLGNIGMVTSAVWSDFNNDTWMDLIVVGEWMPVRIFQNNQGKLEERKDFSELGKTNGWWCALFASDIDGDGDTDYLLGNAGTNLQFHPTPEKPISLRAADFNEDGVIDPLLTYFIKDQNSPLASRDEMLEQINSLRKKFIRYEDYAKAKIEDIVPQEQLLKSNKFFAYTLQSSWLENEDGKNFKVKPLPPLAQLSAIHGFLVEDLDGNGTKEILMAGNFFPYKAQLGRNSASTGLILTYEKGAWKQASNVLSNAWLNGDIRDVTITRFNNGMKRIMVSRNNDSTSVYAP